MRLTLLQLWVLLLILLLLLPVDRLCRKSYAKTGKRWASIEAEACLSWAGGHPAAMAGLNCLRARRRMDTAQDGIAKMAGELSWESADEVGDGGVVGAATYSGGMVGDGDTSLSSPGRPSARDVRMACWYCRDGRCRCTGLLATLRRLFSPGR